VKAGASTEAAERISPHSRVFHIVIVIMALIEMSRCKQAVTTVLCFGDSWTYGNGVGLAEHMRMNGHKNVEVITKDQWGSTAEYFAKNSELLPRAVEKYKADYVLMSMGGNDFKNIYWKKKQYVAPWTALSQIDSSIRTVLDSLYKEHPNVKVVTYGYDFPGCIGEVVSGNYWSGSSNDLSSSTKFLLFIYKSMGVRFINYSAMRLGTAFEKMSKDYAKQGNSFTYVPLWGTLQRAATKKATYDLGLPSPSEYMNDPIHANQKGFGVLMGEMYLSYFKPQIDGPTPVITPEPTPSLIPSPASVDAPAFTDPIPTSQPALNFRSAIYLLRNTLYNIFP